jgi:hypothetical protein
LKSADLRGEIDQQFGALWSMAIATRDPREWMRVKFREMILEHRALEAEYTRSHTDKYRKGRAAELRSMKQT